MKWLKKSYRQEFHNSRKGKLCKERKVKASDLGRGSRWSPSGNINANEGEALAASPLGVGSIYPPGSDNTAIAAGKPRYRGRQLMPAMLTSQILIAD
ncbi:hypothetical protein J6590_001628 [Homalodisca vitripennis]|nr:hypothetical protein J6590_001628 [Homalodisca vitripennis]